MSRELRSKRARSKCALGLLGVLLACGLVATGAQAQADHLLMSKVVVKARPNPTFGSEYVAITNPTAVAIDLSDYYLSDETSSTDPYWDLVRGGGLGGGGTSGDFNARFPDGTILAAGETIVIAVEGSTLFNTQFGLMPDFELFEDGTVPDDVPDMIEAYPGGIGTGLGNTGSNAAPSTGWLDDDESLILYHWDGISDLVDDVDYLTWGSDAAVRLDKSAASADGPDADTDATAYLADTAPGAQSPMTVSTFLQSNDRLDSTEGTETPTGGNGFTDNDETSENLATTWGIGTMDPPVSGDDRFAAPVISAAALAVGAVSENADATINITLLSPPSNAADEMIVRYRIDGGAWATVGAYPVAGNDWGATIPGQLRDVVVDWWVTVTGEEDGVDTWPSAAPFYYETYTVQPPVDPGDGPPHLLLTEVCATYSENEFVEIYNPTDEPVSLDNYYLTDAVHNDQGYWLIPNGVLTSDVIGGGTYNDFQARFPAGYTIPAGGVITVSLFGSDGFNTAWSSTPDFELIEDGTPDGVPDMLEVFPGSNHPGEPYNTAAGLTNSGEVVALYYWDGVSDLVTDIDIFSYGASESSLIYKTGVSIGSSTYAADTPVTAQTPFTAVHSGGDSYHRLGDSETGEITSGGNGPGGHDETSEPFNATWNIAAGSPGIFGVPDLSITGAQLSPARPEPAEAGVVTAAVIGSATVTGVTVHYALDGGLFTAVACVAAGGNDWTGTIPGQDDGTVVNWYVSAAGSGGEAAVWPDGAPTTTMEYTVEVFIPGEEPPHLLLTEVCIKGTDSEFVEIYNPTTEDVSLDDFYLTDAVHNSAGYWLIPNGVLNSDAVGGGTYNDFQARFPAGYVIPAGEVITVSLTGSSAYEGAWDMAPDFELIEDGSSDNVPDMLEVFPGSNQPGEPYNTPAGLSNAGEIIILYYWDGVSDLVTDIDMFAWGSSASSLVNKTGVTIGASTYAADTPTANQTPFPTEHDFEQAYQRLDAEEGTEPETGGNGSEGHDETGENFPGTWLIGDATPGVYNPYVASVSFDPPKPLAGQASVFTLELVDVAGLASPDTVVFHYQIDSGADNAVPMTHQDGGTWEASLPGWPAGVTVSWYVAIGFESTTVYYPANYEEAPAQLEIIEALSLVVPARTFLPAFERFPITFTFPVGHEAVLRVFDLEGRVVRTIYDNRWGSENASINVVEREWDGRNDVFELVKAGMYIVHLQVTNEITGERTEKSAPAVVATRLSN